MILSSNKETNIMWNLFGLIKHKNYWQNGAGAALVINVYLKHILSASFVLNVSSFYHLETPPRLSLLGVGLKW